MKIEPNASQLEKIRETENAILFEGREILDPKPNTIHTNQTRPLTLAEQIERVMRKKEMAAEMAGYEETEEEVMDFDIEDETPLPLTEHELVGMEEEIPESVAKRNEEIVKKAVEEPDPNPEDPDKKQE